MFDPLLRTIPSNIAGAKTAGFFPPVVQQAAPAAQQPQVLAGFTSPQFTNTGFANFDAVYNVDGPVPKTGTLQITHKVFPVYPASMNQAERTAFETDLKKSVHDGWSDKYLLTLNIPGFAPYRCKVEVTVNIVTNKKDAHTVIDVVKPGAKEKRFRSRVSGIHKEKDSATTHTAKLDLRDPSKPEERRTDTADLIKNVGNFDFDSAVVNKDCADDIQEIKRFISSIPASVNADNCKYTLEFTGRASSEGSAAYNKELSRKRIKSVEEELGSQDGRCFSIENSIGERNAKAEAEYRRVTVAVFINDAVKTNKTQQNVAAHEFGHMIGLGDEYIESKPATPGTLPKEMGDQPTHYDVVKEGIDQAAADELLVQNSDSIMASGNTVKRGHYIAFVAALDAMTRPEMPANRPQQRVAWKVE